MHICPPHARQGGTSRNLKLPGVGRAGRGPGTAPAAGSSRSSPAAAPHTAAAAALHTGPTAGHRAAHTAQREPF